MLMKVVWRCAATTIGVLFVMTSGVALTQQWPADNWDSLLQVHHTFDTLHSLPPLSCSLSLSLSLSLSNHLLSPSLSFFYRSNVLLSG